MVKNVIIKTNQTDQSDISVSIAGPVEKFMSLSHDEVFLIGRAGDNISREVIIIPEKKYPFKITGVKTKNTGNITYDLAEYSQEGKMGYVLSILNSKKSKGVYSESILLQTDSSVRPEIEIRIYGHIDAQTTDSE